MNSNLVRAVCAIALPILLNHACLAAQQPSVAAGLARNVTNRSSTVLVLPVRFLLNDAHVQRELSIDPQAVAAMSSETARYLTDEANRRRVLSERIRELDPDPDATPQGSGVIRQQEALVTQFFAEKRERVAEFELRLLGMLTREQQHRVEQINAQLAGPAAFGFPQVRRRLNLELEQVAELGRIHTEWRRDVANAGQLEKRGALNQDELKATLRSHRSRAMEACVAVLTREQRNEFARISGTPISFALEDISREIRGAPGTGSAEPHTGAPVPEQDAIP